MNIILIACLTWIQSFTGVDHDVNMAVFKLSMDETNLTLDLSFDKEDYANVNAISIDQITKVHVQDYLNKTTTWRLDLEQVNFIVERIVIEDDHCRVISNANLANYHIEQINIKNNFLVSIDNQANVIMLDFHGSSRGFRMSAIRTEINVKY